MKNFYCIIFNLIFIELILQIYGQSISKSFILPLNYSSLDNLYYIQLNSNNEKIPKNFIIDTTYSSIAFLCDNYNKDELSNNSSDKDKIFINSKININNIISKDKNTIDEFISINTDIECYINKSDFFINKNIDERYGILGLNNGNNTFIDTLYNFQIIKEKIFSICLSKNNGYFGLGGNIGMDTYIQNGQEINYINILSSENNFFKLKINSIKINNIKFENEYLAILDTSKSHTYFPKNLCEQIVANLLFKNNKLEEDSEMGFCSIIKEEEEINFYFNFHDLHFHFDNYIFIWKAKNYFYKNKNLNDEHEIKLCFSFKELNEDDNSDNNKIILGTDFMIEHEIIFDKNNQVIAFINTNCDSLFKENTDIENNNNQINNSFNVNYNNTIKENIDDNEEEKENEIEKEKENIKEKEKEIEEEKESDNKKEKEREIENEKENNMKEKEVKKREKEETYEKEKEKTNNNSEELSSSSSYISETSEIITSEINDISSDLDNYSDNSTSLSFSTDNLENIIENTTYEIIEVNTTEKIIYNTTQLNQDIDRDKVIEIQTTSEPTIKKETTIITEKIKIVPTTIINIPTTIVKNIPTTEVIKKNNSFSNNTEIDKNNLVLNNDTNTNTNNQPEKKNKFFEIIKSFLKNKLIYFVLTFIAIILCLVAIIMVSCMIISCFKYCQRRRKDYVEQIDIEVQKYSKASSSYSG